MLLTVPKRRFCCGSLLLDFVVGVSVTFHLMGVNYFCSVSVAEWPPFLEIVAHSVDHMFFLYFDYCIRNISYIPFWF